MTQIPVWFSKKDFGTVPEGYRDMSLEALVDKDNLVLIGMAGEHAVVTELTGGSKFYKVPFRFLRVRSVQ